MRPTLSTSLGPASTKRFADRHAAHAELGGQFSLLELGAVAKPSAHDRVLELHVDVVRQSLALNAVQVAVCLSQESRRVPLLCAPCHEYRLQHLVRGIRLRTGTPVSLTISGLLTRWCIKDGHASPALRRFDTICGTADTWPWPGDVRW
jgi:hypothetical protein